MPQTAAETRDQPASEAAFEDGFTGRTKVGALFVAFVMLPGAIYLGLVSGESLGSAAEWVTIVLFAEVARRSFMPLKRQEIFVLFYIAAALSTINRELGVSGGAFGNLIWNGYLHVAPQATGTPVTIGDEVTTISRAVPWWAVPPESSPVWTVRTFFHPHWLVPIGLLTAGQLLEKVAQVSSGYALFRLTSDVERLPFPMAPVTASGATALAEAGSKQESWRWRVFSIGAMLGLVFGFVYLGIPIFTGTVLPEPISLLPLPFWDLTSSTESVLPAAAVGLSLDLTHIFTGFVLPLPLVIGMALTSVLSQVGVNPVLYENGLLPTYRKGANALWTKMATDLDLWMSVDIGLKLAVAVIGTGMVVRTLSTLRLGSSPEGAAPPPGRGDFDLKRVLVVFLAAQAVFVLLAHRLVPAFPLLILCAFAFLGTPLLSYVSARLYGLSGRGVGLRYLQEALYIRSGYRGVDVWFLPSGTQQGAMHDYGLYAQRFREAELTGTTLSSIVRAEVFVFPLILIASFCYWAFLWKTSAIPSSQFPYAQMYWPVHVTYRVLWMSATTEGGKAVEQFVGAIRPGVIVPSAAAGLGLYGACCFFKVPALFFYGAVAGVGQMMTQTIPHLIGGALGRLYFEKRFGLTDWRRYAPVLLAGFSCGMGLIAMVAIALGLITKSVSFLPF